MKTKLSIFLCILGVATSARALSLTNTFNGHVTLAWSCDTNDLTPELDFRIYETTNLTTPLSQWQLLTNVMATNFMPYQISGTIATNFSASLDVQPSQYYFVATASNFWGESGLSNYAITSPSPSVINTLKIAKAP